MTPAVNNSRPLVMQGSGSNGGSNYTFHINGANYSPEEIANVVMAKIKQTESVARERS
jgi:molecular chaperone DnaK (HSP70)